VYGLSVRGGIIGAGGGVMPAITLERDVAAPVDRVWDVFTDLDQAPERLSMVTDIERPTDQPFGEGTTWRETRKMFGRPYTEQMTITACRPPERYVVEAESSGAHYTTEFAFEPVAAGTTHVRVTFGAEPTGTLAKVFNRLMGQMLAKSVTKALRKDIDELARAAEQTP
jgi:carbon monoxide dehydrogenase subunit G